MGTLYHAPCAAIKARSLPLQGLLIVPRKSCGKLGAELAGLPQFRGFGGFIPQRNHVPRRLKDPAFLCSICPCYGFIPYHGF